MKDEIIFEKYTDNGTYKYKINYHNNSFRVQGMQKITDDYMGESWFDYVNIHDCLYIADTLERAKEIGDEILKNLI